MKTTSILFAAVILAASCSKKEHCENPAADKWNGYGKYLKAGEQVHTLWAGRNINVGTVTYGIDAGANFYATYDCSASGWLISETHMYAGDKAGMPLNRPGAPKTGLFPNSGFHTPWVSTFTYTVPLSLLPPCESPGFVAAAHAVVHSPYGQEETAWADGDYTFSDKGWGWYDDYYFNTSSYQSTIIYATTVANDSLRLYHLDVINADADLIMTEYVGNAPGSYDGAAYDTESGLFFFVKYNTGELWVNDLQAEGPSFCAGSLDGTAASGTFHDGKFYYADEVSHTINRVAFNSDWAISGETVLDTIPGMVTVYDIAMSPGGDFLYMTGHCDDGETELMTWELATGQFYTMSVPVIEEAQIAFGGNGKLYAVAPDDGEGSSVYWIDISNCTLVEIADETILLIDDPFSDVAMGPGM